MSEDKSTDLSVPKATPPDHNAPGAAHSPSKTDNVEQREHDRALPRLEAYHAKTRARSQALQHRPELLEAVADTIGHAYAIVGETFDPSQKAEIDVLLDRLDELGAVVVRRS